MQWKYTPARGTRKSQVTHASKCPKCDMDLQGMKKSAKVYSCFMHPEVTSAHSGKCSKCGMDLAKSKKEKMKMV